MRFIKHFLVIAATVFWLQTNGQDLKTIVSQTHLSGVNALQSDSIKRAIIDSVFQNPALYNDAYLKFLNSYKSDSSQLFKFLRNLNLKFKTFQADDRGAALGFEYNYANSWTKSKTTPSSSAFQTYSLNLSGNVAFNEAYNVSNLLESGFTYNASWMFGGKVRPLDSAGKLKFQQLQQEIINANIAQNSPLVRRLYVQRGALIQTSNQYYMGINGDLSYETTQDFSKRQFTPGILVNLGAKPWDYSDMLIYFNLPDYPFALIRLITGTEHTFKLSAASFPSALVGIVHVLPGQDVVRQTVTGNLDPYNRFKGEIDFKTEVCTLPGQIIYCSANLRYYQEISPSAAVQAAGINKFVFFSASVEATSGFFVSFSSGRLPFDAGSTNVYGLGFHYSLGK